jgi:DNA-binding PadR family transcriptional regulator
MLSITEATILNLLMKTPNGHYGSEICHESEGRIKRTSVYSLLGRLEAAGYVKSKKDEATNQYAIPRTRYKITGEGRRALDNLGEFMGAQFI